MGKIIEIQQDVIRATFTATLPNIGSILKTKDGSTFIVEKLEDDSKIVAVILGIKEEIEISEEIIDTKKGIQGPIGGEIFGNVFNVNGNPSGETNILTLSKTERNIKNNKSFHHIERQLETGIKAIDFLTPIFEGSKLGIFGGAGVGKTLIIKEIIFNTSNQTNSKSIFVGIGERSREGQELIAELNVSDLINKTVLFFAGMNEHAGARFNIIKTALITAEYIREERKENSIIFIDNIFRYVQAGSEVASSLGLRPSTVGYQSTLLSEVAEVQERISTSENGSITSFQSVYVAADDITDPAAVAIFNHLDGAIVLDRNIAAKNIYPAISIVDSTSSNATVNKIGKEHYTALKQVISIVKKADDLEDIISILGIDQISKEDQDIVKLARQLKYYFTQDFFIAKDFTNKEGVFVSLKQTISEIKAILNKEFIDVDPSRFLYIKEITDVNM